MARPMTRLFPVQCSALQNQIQGVSLQGLIIMVSPLLIVRVCVRRGCLCTWKIQTQSRWQLIYHGQKRRNAFKPFHVNSQPVNIHELGRCQRHHSIDYVIDGGAVQGFLSFILFYIVLCQDFDLTSFEATMLWEKQDVDTIKINESLQS